MKFLSLNLIETHANTHAMQKQSKIQAQTFCARNNIFEITWHQAAQILYSLSFWKINDIKHTSDKYYYIGPHHRQVQHH